MIFFPHRRAIRRSVLVTLAVWGFALMAGIANACLLHDGEPRHIAQLQAAEHDAHDATHDGTCNDAWDGAALIAAKPLGHDGNGLDAAHFHADAGGPQRVPVVALERAAEIGLHAHGPPDAIRFLRLRL